MTTTDLSPQPSPAAAADRLAAPPPPVLDLVIPVHDEERGLERSVRAAHAYVTRHLPFSARITIADNASTDGTLAVARRLEAELPGVRVVHLDAKGRGRALHAVWEASDAAVLAYMDVDLSTDLSALLPLVAPLVSGHSEVAIGSRLRRDSHVVRGPRREVISRCYNLILRGALAARFSDAQCGFKAIRADAARELLPYVTDTGWFFDTELLVLAERAGLRIHEVPVDWVDDPDSRVDVVATALDDLRGVWRVGRDLAAGRIPLAELRAAIPRGSSGTGPAAALASTAVPDAAAAPRVTARQTLLGQLVRFGAVGVVCTLAYALLYLVLRGPVGSHLGLGSAQLANFVALLLTAVLNTALNRRHTFGVRGPGGFWRHHAQGLAVFALGWALTAGSLAALHALAPGVGRGVELLVLTVANVVATIVRFTLFRSWVFRGPSVTTEITEGTVR